MMLHYNIRLLSQNNNFTNYSDNWTNKQHTPYILEYNLHPFYSVRGLKNQMRIRIVCRLDSRSRVEFWKNDRAAVRAMRTIQ